MDAQPQRRRFQFGLRTLLAVVIVVAIPLAWIAKERRRSAYEEQIAKQLRNLGSREVTLAGPYDSEELHKYGKLQGGWRKLAQHVLGNRILRIWEPPAKFADLTLLVGLTNLQSLDLRSTPISDLTPLAGLTKLEFLHLGGSAVTDLSPLVALVNLQSLSLDGTKVSDFTPLSHLSELKILRLQNTTIADLAPLAGLTQLLNVYLSKTPIDDLTPLAGLPHLTNLDLHDTQVKDLTPLKGLKDLARLKVRNTRVTKEQIEALRAALPNVQIDHDPFP
jgi:hypothetical protein